MRASEEQQEKDVAGPEDDNTKLPNFVDMDLLINAAGLSDVFDSGPIGWKLLQMRSTNQSSELVLNTRSLFSKSKKFEKRWEKINITYKLVVPSGAGPSPEPNTLSRGTGRDRGIKRMLDYTFGGDEESDKNEGWAMCAQKMAEESCTDQDRIPLNESVAEAANIKLKKGNADLFLCNNKLFRATPVTKTKTLRKKADDSPVVQPGMSDSEVKRRTGFPNEKTMISYIIVACDADVDKIEERQTSLTWYDDV